MFRSRSWFGGGKPKNLHSLDHLKYLYNVLSKNQQVSESNKGLLVETLRSIAEILIWGDQNDSSVFDFFLEKNMLSFFLKIMKQKCGSYVCVQLLQTLNILFENIRDETSLYYLLSNNHVNSIIVHKFDFSDEEVMAYYVSFLKTLSLKLNTHTVHFFYNEHTNDFPLYTEAIKFFNHPESMVRIAVRTLTLNVYKIEDKSMLDFIRDRTAAPYFSNLVWFIGKHVVELDNCVRNDADHQSQNRLADLVAEHLDHLHYLNDILCLDISDLNQVLTDQLLNKLLIPLYIYSLNKKYTTPLLQSEKRQHVSNVVSLFLLSQVFLIIHHSPLVQILAWIIFHSNSEVFTQDYISELIKCRTCLPLADVVSHVSNTDQRLNITDEEKERLLQLTECGPRAEDASTVEPSVHTTPVRRSSTAATSKPFLDSILNSLSCADNDYTALFSLCLLHAVGQNSGVSRELLDTYLFPRQQQTYNSHFVDKLVAIVSESCQPGSKIRLVTLELTLKLLGQVAFVNGVNVMSDAHLAAIAGAKEESTSQLRNFYKSEEIFLDMFEFEYSDMKKKPLNVEFLMMDSSLLLPPTGTPLTGIEFSKRLPCGEVERARKAIRSFFLIRELTISLNVENEVQSLPLTDPQSCVQVENVLDLNNSDLIACTVVTKEGTKIRRFLVIDVIQLILVEPDSKKLGWGVAKFVGFLQDIEVTGDKDDSRCLHITVQRPLSSSAANRVPLLSGKFVFDDHIRCMAAKQRLTKGRIKARQKKMHQIAKLLDLPSNVQLCPSPPVYNSAPRSRDGSASRTSRDQHRPLFTSTQRVPGFAALRRDSGPAGRLGSSSSSALRSDSHDRVVTRGTVSHVSRPGTRDTSRTRDVSSTRRSAGGGGASGGSPRMPRPRSEEIPMEDIGTKQRRENILLSNATNGKFKTPSISSTSASSTVMTSQVVVPVSVDAVVATGGSTSQPQVRKSEETSFMDEEDGCDNRSGECGGQTLTEGTGNNSTNDSPSHVQLEVKKPRRKGQVETV